MQTNKDNRRQKETKEEKLNKIIMRDWAPISVSTQQIITCTSKFPKGMIEWIKEKEIIIHPKS